MTGLGSMLSSELALTALVSICSLLAVWVPFYRGLRTCLHGRAATRKLVRSDLQRGATRDAIEPLALLMLRVLRKSLRENQSGDYPREFILDATRQYVTNEYESHYSKLVSMYSNILPPIGFIGTTVGLLILFVSMHSSNESLELGALALALTSSIFALIGFAVLEGIKIRLYGRLLSCLDGALQLQRPADDAEAPLRPRARAQAHPAG